MIGKEIVTIAGFLVGGKLGAAPVDPLPPVADATQHMQVHTATESAARIVIGFDGQEVVSNSNDTFGKEIIDLMGSPTKKMPTISDYIKEGSLLDRINDMRSKKDIEITWNGLTRDERWEIIQNFKTPTKEYKKLAKDVQKAKEDWEKIKEKNTKLIVPLQRNLYKKQGEDRDIAQAEIDDLKQEIQDAQDRWSILVSFTTGKGGFVPQDYQRAFGRAAVTEAYGTVTKYQVVLNGNEILIYQIRDTMKVLVLTADGAKEEVLK